MVEIVWLMVEYETVDVGGVNEGVLDGDSTTVAVDVPERLFDNVKEWDFDFGVNDEEDVLVRVQLEDTLFDMLWVLLAV